MHTCVLLLAIICHAPDWRDTGQQQADALEPLGSRRDAAEASPLLQQLPRLLQPAALDQHAGSLLQLAVAAPQEVVGLAVKLLAAGEHLGRGKGRQQAVMKQPVLDRQLSQCTRCGPGTPALVVCMSALVVQTCCGHDKLVQQSRPSQVTRAVIKHATVSITSLSLGIRLTLCLYTAAMALLGWLASFSPGNLTLNLSTANIPGP